MGGKVRKKIPVVGDTVQLLQTYTGTRFIIAAIVTGISKNEYLHLTMFGCGADHVSSISVLLYSDQWRWPR